MTTGHPSTIAGGTPALAEVAVCKLQLFPYSRNLSYAHEGWDDRMLFGKRGLGRLADVVASCHLHSPEVQHILRFWKQLQAVLGEQRE